MDKQGVKAHKRICHKGNPPPSYLKTAICDVCGKSYKPGRQYNSIQILWAIFQLIFWAIFALF